MGLVINSYGFLFRDDPSAARLTVPLAASRGRTWRLSFPQLPPGLPSRPSSTSTATRISNTESGLQPALAQNPPLAPHGPPLTHS